MIEATIIVAAWNAADTIERCVASALAQEDVAVEVIVADDASTDDTATIAERAGARVVRTEENGGPAAARNRAMAVASGTWLAVLDADDAMAPGRLKRMIAIAREMGADVVLGNLQRVDEQGREIETHAFPLADEDRQARAWSLESFLREDGALTGGRSLGYLKPLIRREFIATHGISYETRTRNGEDFHLILECLVNGAHVALAPWPDYLYSVREGSISHRADLSHIAALVEVEAEFVEHHRAVLSAEAIDLFERRRVVRSRFTASEEALRALKKSRPSEALAALVREPAAAWRVIKQLGEAIHKRV